MDTEGGASPFLYSVCLNPLDCNLDAVLSIDRLSTHTLSERGCGYCWSGVRGNLGLFARGKYFFRVTVGPIRPVNVYNTTALTTASAIRVGVSRFQTAVEHLGEVPFSWAFCSNGSRVSLPAASTDAASADGSKDRGVGGIQYPAFEAGYGPKLSVGDTVTIALDLTSPKPMQDGRAEVPTAGRGPSGMAVSGNAAGPSNPSLAAPIAGTGAAGGSGYSSDSGSGEGDGTVWMAVNGAPLVRLFSVPLPNHPTESYFPHILLRNISATADFVGPQAPEAQQQLRPQCHQPLPPDLLKQGFRPWQEALFLTADCVRTMSSGPLPSTSECEVIVLTGLPGSGKTTWARRHCEQHPARRYCVLGMQLVLEQMRLACPRTRRLDYVGEPEELYALLADTLTHIVKQAPTVPRNYILDRTHVTHNSRRAAVAPFRAAGFRCVSMVVVVSEADLHKYQKLAFENEGKMVPDEAVARLRAEFTLPHPHEGFHDVKYAMLGVIETFTTVNRQRKEAQAWMAWKFKTGSGAASGSGPPQQQQEQEQQEQQTQEAQQTQTQTQTQEVQEAQQTQQTQTQTQRQPQTQQQMQTATKAQAQPRKGRCPRKLSSRPKPSLPHQPPMPPLRQPKPPPPIPPPVLPVYSIHQSQQQVTLEQLLPPQRQQQNSFQQQHQLQSQVGGSMLASGLGGPSSTVVFTQPSSVSGPVMCNPHGSMQPSMLGFISGHMPAMDMPHVPTSMHWIGLQSGDMGLAP
ncbi:hypothetical protein VaNZ11_005340, partial [Volvox africanus]